MRRFTGNKSFNLLLSFAIAMAVWWLLTRVYPPLVVPTIGSVAEKLVEIAAGAEFHRALGLTVARLLVGLSAGVAAGTVVGALLGGLPGLRGVFGPYVGLMQSVPPISWLVLALLWFGFDGRASVFIVIVATLPVMAANTMEGVRNIDAKLLEMARVYRFSRGRRLAHVILPSILPYFRAGLQVAVGIGSKTVVMGEVLTTASGIGGEITNARLNIEPEGVVAWTIVIVAVYYLLNKLAAFLLRGRKNGTRNANAAQCDQAVWRSHGA